MIALQPVKALRWILRRPYDECEIFGVWDPTGNCAHTVYYSLFVFQHWGQGPCSIAVIRDRELTFCKDMGLVGVVFSPELLDQLVGTMALGHCAFPPPDAPIPIL